MFNSSNKKETYDFKTLLRSLNQEELFRKYTTLNINGRNHSIFRVDKTPGCYFKWYNGILYFVDNAGYNNKLYFDIFDIVSFIYNISLEEASRKIVKENNNNIIKIESSIDNYKKPKLQINFKKGVWEKNNYFMIDPDILEKENVYKVETYWINKGDGFKTNLIFNPKQTLTIAYYFPQTDSVKLYFPYEKEFKFFTNCSPENVYSNVKLDYEKTCFITKSNKDRLVLKYLLDYEAISPQSENQLIPEHYINEVLKCKHQFILFDNDKTGVENSSILSKKTGIKNIFFIDVKDTFDCIKKIGINNTKTFIKSLTITDE